MKILKLKRMKTLVGRIRPFAPKNKKNLCQIPPEDKKSDANFLEENSPNEIDAQDSPKKVDDIPVPEISQSDDRNENLSHVGRRYNLRPNTNQPKLLRRFQIIKGLNSPGVLFSCLSVFF